jgi:hypothetical protein
VAILFEELIDKLKQEDEVDIIQLLGLTSDQIVERFRDEIEDKYEYFIREYEIEEASYEDD